jgi:hypothetical protein
MTFELLEKEELLRIADEFGVEVDAGSKPAEILVALDEDGITLDLAKTTIPDMAPRFAVLEAAEKKAEAKKKAAEPKILVRCTRENSSYQVRGHTFTQAAPFAIMAESDALYVLKNVDGFRRADPAEAEEFYG